MIAALAALSALAIGALARFVILARGHDRPAATLGSLLVAALAFAAVHVGHRSWVAFEERSAATRLDAIDAAWQADPVLAALR